VDNALALQKVNEFLTLLETSERIYRTDLNGHYKQPKWLEVEADINARIGLIEQIANVVDPRLCGPLRKEDVGYSWVHTGCRRATQQLAGALMYAEEAATVLGPQGPKLAASNMHPWVWDHARALWADGHRRSAVQAAATALFDQHLPAKLNRQRDSKGGRDLVGQGFSLKEPEVGSPRLRLPGYVEGSKDWINAHEGAMYLGQGCAQYVRNLITHDTAEPDEQEAFEMLANLSLVARLVDRATRVEVT
jgi:hypothetical protein